MHTVSDVGKAQVWLLQLHKEVEAEKCHSARWVTSTRRPRGDEVSQSQGRGLASSPQPWARHHQSHWHPLTFLCICFNVPLPPSIPPPPQEDLFTSMAYASISSGCLSLSTLKGGYSSGMRCFTTNDGECFMNVVCVRDGSMLKKKNPERYNRVSKWFQDTWRLSIQRTLFLPP